MTKEEEHWFDKLTDKRTKASEIFADPEFSAIWDRLVDMYKESAHFVYELIQNADDAYATDACFLLYKDKLIFKHNGSKKFSISNPETVEEDKQTGSYGDLNSITAVASSTKNSDENRGNSIGKFGIGFKSVYTYTETPEIYDQTISFRIEQKIIPIRLDRPCEGWNDNETWFVLPFNNPKKNPAIAFSEISKQLSELHNPTLFLNNLKTITYQYEKDGTIIKGGYHKAIDETKFFDETKAELSTLKHNVNGETTEEKLWVFSRQKDSFPVYSVGFAIKNGKLIPKADYAYCFFQTKEETHLNFIIHAPFLLTPDRQHLKDDEEHNSKMIQSLAKLAADSMTYLRDIGIKSGTRLIDDDILNIIPIKSADFYIQRQDYNNITHRRVTQNLSPKSFAPFYDYFLDKFIIDNLLPSTNGYTRARKAFWAEDTDLITLFPDKDLSKIVSQDDGHWIFCSLRRSGINDERREWIEKVIGLEHCLGENIFLQNISASFCEEKFENSLDWFVSFYEWLDSAKERSAIAQKKPFFIDQNGRSATIFKNDVLDLFLPTSEENDYHVINKKLYDIDSIQSFLRKLGMTEPSFKDEIFSKILPRYAAGMPDEAIVKSDFKKIIRYYNDCPLSEAHNFIEQIKKKLLIRCLDSQRNILFATADKIYFENNELKNWFKNKPDTVYLDFSFYAEFINSDALRRFFESIGIAQIPRTKKTTMVAFDLDNDSKWYWDYVHLITTLVKALDQKKRDPSNVSFTFYTIDGMDEVLKKIDETNSHLLWNYLIQSMALITSEAYITYYYKSCRTKDLRDYIIPTIFELRNSCWIYTKNGDNKKTIDIFIDEIPNSYNLQSPDAKKLIEILQIKTKKAIDEANLPDEIKNKLATYERLKKAGIDDLTDEEIEEIKQNRLNKNRSSNYDGLALPFTENTTSDTNNTSEDTTRISLQDKITQDVANRSKKIKKDSPKEDVEIGGCDSDEWNPPSFNSERQIEKAKDKLAIELNKIAELEKATEDATKADRYSYQWFKSMLQLEILRSNENNQNSKEVHISFGKVTIDPDPKTQKTLILSQPNKKIPAFIEELYGINLIVHFRGDKPDRSITFEAASIRSFTLRLKMMRDDDVKSLDVDDISSAEIIAKSPVFLLQELQKQFDHLEIDDSANLKHFLCENIRFIFGPPGTGKTTFLAEKVLKPWIKENAECNILVLAPTNKAADVLTKRIMEKTENYSDFLLRFGTTGDEVIENSGVFCNRSFDISKRTQNIVVTTIARLPYDSFVKEGHESLFIRDVKWDYIVVDEASMIPLVQMVYLLYSQEPKGFVIAGDPFQIEPTVAEDSWKKENIYEMVELKDFANHTTKPHSYEVETLETQYRSIPKVGEIYSKLTYNNILKHNRDEAERKPLEIDNLDIQPLNLIKFPVSEYESIYRSKRLGRGSSYQIYSALFTFEFTSHLVDSIVKKYPGKEYSIGIISPYKAEADLIGNLLRSKKFPDEISVLSGTVHSFQGDECDIMLTVFNTPEYISKGDGMFLNHKNIVNVAISRARDYLFVLMPDEKTKNIENLGLINQMEKYMEESGICKRFGSHELEKWMFDSESYLEENAFSTGHQSVNVYGEPEKRYEIRSEDDAIDIQVHQG